MKTTKDSEYKLGNVTAKSFGSDWHPLSIEKAMCLWRDFYI